MWNSIPMSQPATLVRSSHIILSIFPRRICIKCYWKSDDQKFANNICNQSPLERSISTAIQELKRDKNKLRIARTCIYVEITSGTHLAGRMSWKIMSYNSCTYAPLIILMSISYQMPTPCCTCALEFLLHTWPYMSS